MSKQPIVRSKYNPKENFSFEETPGEFKSVTQQSINDIKTYCAHVIANKYKGDYNSRTLYAMVGTVMGNFDLLVSQLREDYGNRRGKLKRAQNLGVKEVGRMLSDFKHVVAQYESALNRYNENIVSYDGSALDESLHYSQDKLVELEKKLKRIEEKNYEA